MWKVPEGVLNRFKQALASQYHLIYAMTWEERRLEQIVKVLSQSLYTDNREVILWSSARGFQDGDTVHGDLNDPHDALQYIASKGKEAIYLMKDLPAHLDNDLRLQRQLRDLYALLSKSRLYIILSHPHAWIPESLKKELFLIELPLPDEQEIFDYLEQINAFRQARETYAGDWISHYASAMHGLTLDEVRHLALRLISEKKLDPGDSLEIIHDEKAQIILKEGYLRLVPSRPSVAAIGGLENLKEWVHARRSLFSRESLQSGIPLPSGILFMGVSGCGKSLAAKAISAAWDLPLIRLDMNLIFSGMYGSPEFAFDRACRIVESIAPVVLWIDEIENAFGYDEGPGSGGNINIFSSFLTWMQEKPPAVFVAATANRIQKLPAEMLRKGRFDQLFFLDLPTHEERERICAIHIAANDTAVATFDLGVLATLTKAFSGAEIEQIIKSARIDAYTEGRDFSQVDIARISGQMVPLSKTMREQIKQLRDWSFERATPASRKTA